jgi:hypothetical protein
MFTDRINVGNKLIIIAQVQTNVTCVAKWTISPSASQALSLHALTPLSKTVQPRVQTSVNLVLSPFALPVNKTFTFWLRF